MPYEITTAVSNNITMLYKDLSLPSLDRNALRALFSAREPLVVETPGFIVFMVSKPGVSRLWPGMTTAQAIEFGVQIIEEGRVTVLDQGQSNLEGSPIPSIALMVHEVLVDANARLTAYGFNYIFDVEPSTKTAAEVVKSWFLNDETALSQAIDGEIELIAPRLFYNRHGIRHDLRVEPASIPNGEREARVTLNAHFEEDSLPEPGVLRSAFAREYDELLRFLTILFEDMP